jgi:hypothetical protein
VAGKYAYLGHITNKQRLGTSILDVSDPRKPRLLSQIHLDDGDSHSHKARVAGDLMIVNVEQNMGPLGRKAADASPQKNDYREGGFKLYQAALQEWPGEALQAASSLRQARAHDVHRRGRDAGEPRACRTRPRRTPRWRMFGLTSMDYGESRITKGPQS